MDGTAKPNILFITCHDLGRHLGCYGVPTVHTPELDRLAASGVRLTRAFATAPSCSPSRAAIATGRYPHANGVMGLAHPPFGWDLHPGERHLAQLLGDAGYDTHLFGFQHVSPRDARPGFGQIHVDHARGLANPVAAKVGAFLQAQDKRRPFYLEVNLEEPHRPYDQDNAVPDSSRGVTVPGYLPEGEESRHEMAALQGALRVADGAVGRILASLDAAGRRENTCVIFAADHGLAMPRAKCTLYDPGLEVAVLLRLPATGHVPAGTLDALVSNVDLLPTLLELAGIPVPANIQGRSFLSALRGEPFTPRAMVFAEKTQHSYYDPMRAVRTAEWKYIRNFEPAPLVEIPADIAQGEIYRRHVARYTAAQHVPAELYDLAADPLETHNLAGVVEEHEVEAWLDGSLTEWMRETNDPLLAGPIPLPGFAPGDATAGH